MLIFTSPAKTLDYVTPYRSIFEPTLPLFSTQIDQLIKKLQSFTEKQLTKTLEVSGTLGALNFERFQQWEKHQQIERPALFTYKGDIYREMYPLDYTKKQLEYAQTALRIISGLYGLVRPFDVIRPYRLEMKVALKAAGAKDLYTFWKKPLTDYVNEEIKLHKHRYVVNLASSEYFKAIDLKALNARVITIEFRQQTKDGILNYGLLAKHARGMMIDFMIKNEIEEIEDLKKFNINGYTFMEQKKDSLFFIKEGVKIKKD